MGELDNEPEEELPGALTQPSGDDQVDVGEEPEAVTKMRLEMRRQERLEREEKLWQDDIIKWKGVAAMIKAKR